MADIVDIRDRVAEAGNWSESADLLIEGIERGTDEEKAYVEGLLRTLCAMVDNFGLGIVPQSGGQ